MATEEEENIFEWKNISDTLEVHYCTNRIISESSCLIWTVENFSRRGGKVGDKIVSPRFSSAENSKCKWHLELYPRGCDKEENVSLFLALHSEWKESVHCLAESSIMDSKDKTIHCVRTKFVLLAEPGQSKSHAFEEFVKRMTILKSITDDIIKLKVIVVASVGDVNKSHKQVEPNAEKNLINDYKVLLKNKKWSDLNIMVDSKCMPAHRVILAARSPVFAAMFEHDTVENRQNQITISDIEYETLSDLLCFIYTSNVSNNETPRIMSLLRAADKYAINDLKAICEELLSASMNSANAFDLLLLADMHSAAKLKKAAIDFICSKATDFLESENHKILRDMKPDVLSDILIHFAEKCTLSEENVCQHSSASPSNMLNTSQQVVNVSFSRIRKSQNLKGYEA